MNLPNKLTVSRLVLSVIIIIILLFPFHLIGFTFPVVKIGGIACDIKYFIAGGLFVIASLTDFLDGMIARKYGLITNTGKMLDAIADKVLVSSNNFGSKWFYKCHYSSSHSFERYRCQCHKNGSC